MRRLIALAVLCLLVSESAIAAGQQRDLPKSKGHYVLVLPKAHDKAQKYRLLVALHGAGDTAENFSRFWAQMLRDQDVILAVPEASSKMGRGFTWNTADLARIEETVEDAVANLGADPQRVALTGFSAGCAIGFHVIAKKPRLFGFFGGMSMAIQRGLATDEELKDAAKDTPVYYMVGKKDPNHRAYEPTVKKLTECGFKLKNEDPDIGHTINPTVAKAMLAFWEENLGALAKK